MPDFKAMIAFVTVVELRSMQAAAEKLGITPSAITQTIQKLENELDMKLINRTTRSLALTEAGELFYKHAAQMKRNADDAVKSLELLRSRPVGELTIACVTGLTDSLFVNMFKSVLDNHPEFQLNLLFDDKVIDLQQQRVDIALRAGSGVLSDNMIARHLYDFELSIVAHRDYVQQKIAEKGEPQSLQELASWDWISFSNNRFNTLRFRHQQQEQEVLPSYRIHCNSLYASRRLTMSGLGVSIQPTVDAQAALHSGELVELFSDWKLPSIPLYLVTLQRVQSEKVRIACELIEAYFAELAQ